MKDIIEKINGWNLEDQFDIAEREEVVERLTCYKDGAQITKRAPCHHKYVHISTTAFIGYVCKKCGHKI